MPRIVPYFRAAYCAIFSCRLLCRISVPHIVLYFRAAYCAIFPCRLLCRISVPHIVPYFRAAYYAIFLCRVLCRISVSYIVPYFRAAYCAIFPCRILCSISVPHIVLYIRAHIVVYFRATNKVNPLSDTSHLTSDGRPHALNTADLKARDRILLWCPLGFEIKNSCVSWMVSSKIMLLFQECKLHNERKIWDADKLHLDWRHGYIQVIKYTETEVRNGQAS